MHSWNYTYRPKPMWWTNKASVSRTRNVCAFWNYSGIEFTSRTATITTSLIISQIRHRERFSISTDHTDLIFRWRWNRERHIPGIGMRIFRAHRSGERKTTAAERLQRPVHPFQGLRQFDKWYYRRSRRWWRHWFGTDTTTSRKCSRMQQIQSSAAPWRHIWNILADHFRRTIRVWTEKLNRHRYCCTSTR